MEPGLSYDGGLTVLMMWLCSPQSDIAELERKLAELREEEVRLEAAISEEEVRIQAVHMELDSEDGSLREERAGLSRREQELQEQQVQRHRTVLSAGINEGACLSLSLTLSLSHTHSLSLSTLTLSLSHSLTLSHHSLTHSLSLTHTHTLSLLPLCVCVYRPGWRK